MVRRENAADQRRNNLVGGPWTLKAWGPYPLTILKSENNELAIS